uniref:Uncharacterized protein n=1 Tax=Panagrolaimus sp. PS1159 TaxID=55785 RepID=A0AC35FBT5_9BILA
HETRNPNDPYGPGSTKNPNDPNGPGEHPTRNPNDPGNSSNPPSDAGSTKRPSVPQKCKDLLPKNVCKHLQPLCVKHSLRKAASALPKKDDRDVLLSQIENSEGNNVPNLPILQSLVKKGAYPENIFKNDFRCQSNTVSSACSNYVSQCSTDLSPAVCKATTSCTTTKEFYKTITAEIISKLCPETCLVQECYNNHSKPEKLDLDSLIVPELLTCLLA